MKTALISGAGIAGPTLAFWLDRLGYAPTIVERAPAFRTGGYMIDFWGVGYEVAERMDLLPAIHEVGYRIDQVRIVNARGRTAASFSARVFEKAARGRFISLPRGDLARVIYERVADRVETRFGTSITALQNVAGGVDVAFDNSPSRTFDIVVGADGLHSNVRALAFGPAAEFERHLGYYTAAFHARGYPHREEGVYTSYSIPGGQLARYALRDDWSAFFFLFKRRHQDHTRAHEPEGQRALIDERFRGRGWECDEILRALYNADDLYFDDVAQAHVPAWSRGRVTLLGDAAYCPSLLAGEGAGLAMAGAYVLARALARWPSEPERAFADYQDSFRPLTRKKQRGAERFARWFAPETRVGMWVRNLTTMLLNVPGVGTRLAASTLSSDFALPPLPSSHTASAS